MGGMIGQGLAIRHPAQVRSLVLAHTAARHPAAAQASHLSPWEQPAAFEAGASLVHLHVRNDDGSPTPSSPRSKPSICRPD
jgi:uncharacterized protein (DUF849 family)